MNISTKDYCLLLIMVLIWGCNYVVGKIGLTELPPLLFMGLRFLLAAIIIYPFLKHTGVNHKSIFIYSVIVGLIHFGAIFSGLSVGEASVVILVSQLSVPLTVILSFTFFSEKTNLATLIGIVLSIIGTALFTLALENNLNLLTVIYSLIGAISWSIGTIWMKNKLNNHSVITINFWLALYSTPMFFVLSSVIEGSVMQNLTGLSIRSFGALLYQSILVIIVGYGIWNFAISKYQTSKVVPITLLVPLIGLISSYIFLNESLKLIQIIGVLITLSGTYFIMFKKT